jgi:hypothetical protein
MKKEERQQENMFDEQLLIKAAERKADDGRRQSLRQGRCHVKFLIYQVGPCNRNSSVTAWKWMDEVYSASWWRGRTL